MVDAQSAAGSREAAIQALQEIGGEAATLTAAGAVPVALGRLRLRMSAATLQIGVGARRIGTQ